MALGLIAIIFILYCRFIDGLYGENNNDENAWLLLFCKNKTKPEKKHHIDPDQTPEGNVHGES